MMWLLLVFSFFLSTVNAQAESFIVTGGSWTQFASGTFRGITDFQLFGSGLSIQDSGSVSGGGGVLSADPIHALTFNQSFSYTSAFTPTAFPGDANPLEGLFEVKGMGSTPPNILPEGRYERSGGSASLTGFFTLDGGSSFHTLSGIGTTTLTFIGEFGTFTSRLEKIHVDFEPLIAAPEPASLLLLTTGLLLLLLHHHWFFTIPHRVPRVRMYLAMPSAVLTQHGFAKGFAASTSTVSTSSSRTWRRAFAISDLKKQT